MKEETTMTRLVSNEAFEMLRDNKYRVLLETRSKADGDRVMSMIISDIGIYRDYVLLMGEGAGPIKMRMHTFEALVTRVEQHPDDMGFWWAEWAGSSKSERHHMRIYEDPWKDD